jgi:hypothetical protein
LVANILKILSNNVISRNMSITWAIFKWRVDIEQRKVLYLMNMNPKTISFQKRRIGFRFKIN